MLVFLLMFAPMAVLADVGKSEEIHYVALGDSLAAGTLNNGSEGVGYVGNITNELESNGYEVHVTNKGKNGFTTADVLASLRDNIAELAQADIITISAGANDVLADLIELIRENPELLEDFEPEYLTEEGIAQLLQAVEETQREALEAAIAAATAKDEAQESVETAKTDIIEAGAAANLLIAGLRDQFEGTPIWSIAEGIIEELEATIASALAIVSTEVENIDGEALKNASEALIYAVELIESVENFIPEELKENVQGFIEIINDAVSAANDARDTLVYANEAENAAIEARKKAEEKGFLLENILKAVEAFEGIPGKSQVVGANIGEILGTIRSVNQTAEIYVMGYYNALPYLEEVVTQPLLAGLNEALKVPTGVAGAIYIPTAYLFEANNFLPNPFNIHPNEAGYEAIANAFIEQISKAFPGISEPEEPTEQHINLGEAVTVSRGQWIFIDDTNVRIQLPDDLPEGTTLIVTATDEETLAKADDLEQVGDVLNFTFNFPTGFEDFEGNYQLIMGYDYDSTDEIDIYYFNESAGKWESQTGEVNPATKEISLTVLHFSNYGVFSEVDQPEEPKDKEDPPVSKTPAEEPVEDENDDSDVVIEDEKDQDIKEAGILPNTATNNYNMLLIGIVFIGIATVILYSQRKRQQTDY